MAKTRYRAKKGKSKRGGKRKKSRVIGGVRHYRGVLGGGWYAPGWSYKLKTKKKGRKKGGPLSNSGWAKCKRCRRVIFGGQKGMGTHNRRKHRGSRR